MERAALAAMPPIRRRWQAGASAASRTLADASPLFFFSHLIFPGDLQSTSSESSNEKENSAANSSEMKNDTWPQNIYLNSKHTLDIRT